MPGWLCSGLAVWLACCCAAAEDREPPERPRPELVVTVGHASAISSVAFSGDGTKVLSGSYDGSVILWDAATGRNLHVLRTAPLPNLWPREAGCVDFAAFGPADGKVVAGCQDGRAMLWDADSDDEPRTFAKHDAAVVAVAVSPDGARAYTASGDSTIRVWDTATARELARIFNLDDHD